ncbi:hypothetical protein KAR91_42075 [Candidatus Pacearchaeota archaeon]|nr:hypothetical protein [Candidatus Pacearchaeota archaeon]
MKLYERIYKGGGEEPEALSEEEVRIALRGNVKEINATLDMLSRGEEMETAFFIYRLKGGE